MIFSNLKADEIVQIDDKTRLDVSGIFSPDGESITLIEIEPETSAGYIDVTTKKYLDWQYSTNGTKTISVRVTGSGAPETTTYSIEVLNASDDNLFSTDNDLVNHESDILKWLPNGRNSFNYKHRAGQTIILEWLDRNGISKSDGSRYVKADITDIEEVRHWSKYQTLVLIFEDLSNAIDDIYAQKAIRYRRLMDETKNRAILRLDTNGDGTTEPLEGFNMTVLPLRRR
jgi:hypothetical protein